MKLQPMLCVLVSLLACLAQGGLAATDHKDFITGPFKDGREATKACLECHDKQASDFIKTQHWNLKGVAVASALAKNKRSKL